MDIHDIAQLAGVSITTVSRVINNDRSVKDYNRIKVQEVIKKYDYRPNSFAQYLGRRRKDRSETPPCLYCHYP